MLAPLDVFAVKRDESTWLGCTETLAQATELIRKAGVGSYFVYSQKTGHKTFYEVTTDGVSVRDNTAGQMTA